MLSAALPFTGSLELLNLLYGASSLQYLDHCPACSKQNHPSGICDQRSLVWCVCMCLGPSFRLVCLCLVSSHRDRRDLAHLNGFHVILESVARRSVEDPDCTVHTSLIYLANPHSFLRTFIEGPTEHTTLVAF